VVSVERDTFPGLLAAGEVISSFVDNGYWLDVGTPAAFITASADIVMGRAPASALETPAGHYLAAASAVIGEGAQLSGGSSVGPAVRVGAGAEIDGSVILDGVAVGAGAVIRASIIGRGSVIGDGAVLDGAVVGDDVTIGPGNELRAGIRLFPGTRLESTSVRFSSDL
jgi:mannose-1-phosphate guanylyltransferase